MAKAKKEDLGKGIRALLSNMEKDSKKPTRVTIAEAPSGTSEIKTDSVEPNPFQPRTDFDEDKLTELADSIKTFGIIQPITVRKLNSKKFQIISGERRWRASQMAGLKMIPAYVREADDQGMLEMALLENIQRSDLNPLEVALSYQRLLDECSLTHEELSSRLGKKRSSITNHLRVLKLPPSVQQALRTEAISLGHGKVIAGIAKVEDQIHVLSEILTKGLSVRAAESMVSKRNTTNNNSTAPATQEHPEVMKIKDRLSDKVGSKVQISRNQQGKGVIKIAFNSDHQFNEIIDSLLEK